MKKYRVVLYYCGKRYCVAAEGLTEEEKNNYIHNQPKNIDWQYFAEEM